jgi:general secretion pathway protein D
METFKPILPSRGRAALLAATCLIVPLTAGEPQGAHGLAEKEFSRRNASVEESQMLLRKGDEAYQAGRYGEAVEAYAGARDLIPDAPVSAELRKAATERYAQASVEQARLLARKGDVAGAKATVDKVLGDGVAPNDPGALDFRSQLDDPIRTNPALTAEHAKNVDEVRRTLYTAEGALNLGKYDEAKTHYEEVLRIDPTNTAARRGMEQVAAAKSGYQKSSYDHTRAEMLSQVDAAWETQITAPDLGVGPEDPGGPLGDAGTITVATKLDRIIIPRIILDQATLDEALEYLRSAANKADVELSGAENAGVNFTVNLGAPESPIATSIRSKKFDLQLSQIPLRQVLKYITEITQTAFTTDDYSVVITPLGSTSDELIARSYRVPPDFLTSMSSGAGGGAAEEDPFGEAPANDGLLTKRLSAQEALSKNGVNFPEGASAIYNAATNTLRVVNTATNQEFISQIVDAASKTEPVTVAVRVTMIKVEKSNLEELGYDWLLNPFPLNAGNEVFASGGTIGNTPGRKGRDFVSPVGGTSIDGVPANPAAMASNLATNGLRSGDQGLDSNTLDGLLSNQNRSQQTSVAPGIMAFTGLFTDSQVQMVMRGLNQKKGVDIMARPAIMTRSGQASSVNILREFIYPTEYEPPELPNSVGSSFGNNTSPVTPATPTAFEKKDVGISLEVLPVADANKTMVDVTVNPSFVDFDGFVNYGSPINSASQDALGNQVEVQVTENAILMPVFSANRANTQVTIADGATIAIAGLMAESTQTVEDKVPVLGDIPFLGRFFRSSGKKPVSTAIIFLVNVELLDPTGRPYRDR